MDDIIIARALHVLAVVIWIDGVAMATTIAPPAIRHGNLGADRLKVFPAIEHRFVWQARTAVITVGLTGFYMTVRLDLWDRFRSAGSRCSSFSISAMPGWCWVPPCSAWQSSMSICR